MRNAKLLYSGHRFLAEVISFSVRWYFRFQLSVHDIEELLFERGVVVSYETVRWCDKSGGCFAHHVKMMRCKPGTTWRIDEMFATLRERPYLLWARPAHGSIMGPKMGLSRRVNASDAYGRP